MTTITAATVTHVDRALRWCDRHGKSVTRTVFIGTAALAAGIGVHSAVGGPGLAGLMVVAIATVALWWGARSLPQATGATASTLGWAAVLAALGSSLSPLLPITGVPDFVVTYPVGLIAIAMVAYALPSAGVHRGWTVAVAQGVLMATLPLSVAWPATTAAGLGQLGGVLAGIGLVAWRSRKANHVDRSGWRLALTRISRALTLTLVAAIVSGSALLANPAPAAAFPDFGLGDKARDMMTDQICSFTRPDLTGEEVGSGPESTLSNLNLGGVQTYPESNSVPKYAEDAGNFTRLVGENKALDQYTLYEVAGLRGIKWVNWQQNKDGTEECGIMPWASVLVGNMIFKVSNYLLQITIALKEHAQVSNPLEGFYAKTSPMVEGLFNNFFFPMGAVMLLLAGVSIMVKSMRDGGLREGIGNAGMSMVVLMIGGFFYGGIATASWVNPDGNGFYMVASVAEDIVGGLNSGLSEIALSTLDDQDTAMMCQPTHDQPSEGAAKPGQRYSSCILAESLAYRPWALGQFGRAGRTAIVPVEEPTRFGDPRLDQEPTVRPGPGLPCYNNYGGCMDMRSYLIAQEGGPSIQAARAACVDGAEGDEQTTDAFNKCDPYYAVAQQLYAMRDQEGDDPDIIAAQKDAASAISAYRAQGSMPHVAQAFAALVGTISVTIGIAAMSAITLGWHAWLFVMFLIGPLKLLWGAYPGKSKMAREWVSDVVQSFTMRLCYGVMVTLMILLVSIVFASTMNTGLKVLWSVAVLIMFWVAMKKVEAIAKPEGATSVGIANMSQNAIGTAGTATALVAGTAAYGTAKVATAPARYAGGKVAKHYDKKVTRGINERMNRFDESVSASSRNAAAAVKSGAARAGAGAGHVVRTASAPVADRVRRAGSTVGFQAQKAGAHAANAARATTAPVTDPARRAGAMASTKTRGAAAAAVVSTYGGRISDARRDRLSQAARDGGFSAAADRGDYLANEVEASRARDERNARARRLVIARTSASRRGSGR